MMSASFPLSETFGESPTPRQLRASSHLVQRARQFPVSIFELVVSSDVAHCLQQTFRVFRSWQQRDDMRTQGMRRVGEYRSSF